MKELAILGVVLILAFTAFVIWWNKKWKGKVLDEREMVMRLKVRELISRAVEISLIGSCLFHFFVRPLSGLEALVIIGLAGILGEAFGNFYFRRNDSPSAE